MTLAFRSRHHHIHASRSASVTRAALLKVLETKYTTSSSSPDQEPTIPDPEVFTGLGLSLNTTTDYLPNIAECCVHLRLLEAFSILKQKVLTSNALDRAFGIAPKDSLTTVRGGKRVRKSDTTFAERRKVKWELFVRFAARRFLIWWMWLHVVTTSSTGNDNNLVTEIALPPLDVLMIWHAFLLNPSIYRKFCAGTADSRLDASKRLAIKFPWAQIHTALSDDNRSYTMPSSTGTQGQSSAHVGPFDLFQALVDVNKSQSKTAQAALKELALPEKTPSLDEAHVDSWNPLAPLFNPQGAILFGSALTSDKNTQLVKSLAVVVKRQEQVGLTDKMANMLWLRSPALRSTLERAIIRYERFLILSKEENLGTNLMIPTLDINLVWNTHLCSPELYRAGCIHFAGREVEKKDNDIVGKKEREDALRRTEKLYELKFGGDEYNACLCWECEAIQAGLESWKKNKYNQGGVVDSAEGIETDFVVIAKKAQEDVEYYRVVELARRTGKPIPVRMDASSIE